MVLQTMKGFYKNGKYVFMVAGIVYLAIILFVYFLLSGLFLICGENLSLLFEDVVKILNSYIRGFQFSSLLEIGTVFDNLWQAFHLHMNEFYAQIIALTSGLLLFLYIAMELAKSFAIINIKHESFKSNLFWVTVSIAIRTVVSLLFTALIAYLAFQWIYSLVFLILIYLIFKAVLNVLYIKFSKRKGVKLKKLFNLKTLLKLILMYVIAFLFIAIIAVILFFLFNIIIAVLLAIPIAIYLNACVEGISYGMFEEVHSQPQS